MSQTRRHLHTTMSRYTIEFVLVTILFPFGIQTTVQPVAGLYCTMISHNPVFLLVILVSELLWETHTVNQFLREIIIELL